MGLMCWSSVHHQRLDKYLSAESRSNLAHFGMVWIKSLSSKSHSMLGS